MILQILEVTFVIFLYDICHIFDKNFSAGAIKKHRQHILADTVSILSTKNGTHAPKVNP